MGEIPHWYAVLRAARYLGVAPWDLALHEPLWLNLALASEGAENRAEQERAKRQQRKRGKR